MDLIARLRLVLLLPRLAMLGLRQLGWTDSIRQSHVERHGMAVPWLPYSVVDYLDQMVSTQASVLEVGAGNSTIWWALRGNAVRSIEGSPDWYQSLQSRLSAMQLHDVDLELAEGRESVVAALSHGTFDVVVLDGFDPRARWVPLLIERVAEGGLLVWDNIDRESDSAVIAQLRSAGFNELKFFGIGPINRYAWQTSVFCRVALSPAGREVEFHTIEY